MNFVHCYFRSRIVRLVKKKKKNPKGFSYHFFVFFDIFLRQSRGQGVMDSSNVGDVAATDDEVFVECVVRVPENADVRPKREEGFKSR